MIRPTDDIVCSATVSQLPSSDHYCVVCDLSVIKPVNHAELKQSRNLYGINLTTFKADVCQLISLTSCPTFEMLDDNLRLILEKHAQLHSCRVPINQNDPWYNAIKSDIIAAKKHRYWTERQYLKYPTILNKQQFNKAKNSMAKIMHRARSKFYLSEIYPATSNKELICHMQQTVRARKIGSFSKYISNGLAYFFINKVKQIRTSIDQHKLQTQNSTTQTSLTIFESFHPVTITQLCNIKKLQTYLLRFVSHTNVSFAQMHS